MCKNKIEKPSYVWLCLALGLAIMVVGMMAAYDRGVADTYAEMAAYSSQLSVKIGSPAMLTAENAGKEVAVNEPSAD